MLNEISPPPSATRLAKVFTASSRVKPDPAIAQVMTASNPSLPAPRPPAIITVKEALAKSSALVDQIFAVVEQMKFHKKQARRLAELASSVFDAIDIVMLEPPLEDAVESADGPEKLVRVLYRIEERLRDVGSGNLVTRMNEHKFVQQDLEDLEEECAEVAEIFNVEAPVNIERSTKAKHEDELAIKDLATRLEKDPEALADKIGLRGTKLDGESQKSLQIMLYSIEHTPEKVFNEFHTFAQSAARTVYSRTKEAIPRDLPWHVSPSEFRVGDKIGEGGFSTVYKGIWTSRQTVVAIKKFDAEGQNIDEMIKEIIIWKNHKHPCLLKFIAGCVWDRPKFIVSDYCENGNAVDYLQSNPKSDRAKLLLDVSRGMLYLHLAKIVHGDLKARNVLINNQGRALVADFGLAEFERPHGQSRTGMSSSGTADKSPRLIGTPHWLAPECFKDVADNKKLADVWAMGMTSYELYENGKVPLGHIPVEKLSETLEAGERPQRPTSHAVPDYIWKMMELCWSLNTIKRPSFSEITMYLGLYQDPDLETLQEIRLLLKENRVFTVKLNEWPSFLERLIQILTEKLNPVPANSKATRHDSLQLFPEAEQQMILALLVLKDVTSITSGYSTFHKQLIEDSGALSALYCLLTRKDNIKNPEIMTLGCEIVANVIRSPDNSTKASITQGDFVDALLQLIDSPDSKVSTHAMSTVQSLISSSHRRSLYHLYSEARQALKKRVVDGGIVPKLLSICKASKEVNPLCQCLGFIAMLGTSPTALEEAHIKEISPVLMDIASSDVDLKPRQHALYSLAKLVEANDAQAGYVRSCGLFGKLLDHLWGQGPELYFEREYFTAGKILEHIAEEEHIASILELLNNPHLFTKLSACLALAAVGQKTPTSEGRQVLARKYPVFNALQPLLSSNHTMLIKACRKALSLYSSPRDSSFVLELLRDESSAARLMATQICITLVEQASEDDKIAVANSGILPALKTILDDPPPQKGLDRGPRRRPDVPPNNFAFSLGLSDSDDSDDSDGGMFRILTRPFGLNDGMIDVPKNPANEKKAKSIVSTDQASLAKSDLTEAVARTSENVAQSTQIEGSETVSSVATIVAPLSAEPASLEGAAEVAREDPPTSASTTPKDPVESTSASMHSPSADHDVASAMAGNAKQSRSPKARAVTFDSADHVIVVDTASSPKDDECCVQSGRPGPTYDASEEAAKKARASAAKTDANNKEAIYRQAYTALDHILSNISEGALDTIAMAYVAASVHQSLINAIAANSDGVEADGKIQLTCLRMLYRMSMSTCEIRSQLVFAGLLQNIRSVVDCGSQNPDAQRYCCDILQSLLSDEEDDDVKDAILDAEFVPPLAKYIRKFATPQGDQVLGAQALSQLVWIFDDRTSQESVTLAISALDDYCNKSSDNLKKIFEPRMYLIVSYLRHPLPEVRKFGLSLALHFAKRSVDHRRNLETAGLKDAVRACLGSGDKAADAIAADILETIKSKKGNRLFARREA